MDTDKTELLRIAGRLNEILAEIGQEPLAAGTAECFAAYYALLARWNARTNLTAIRDEEGMLRRHFAESIACARALPPDISTLLDLGSGAGFPGLPIALCRPDIAVTLAESQNKKAAFLREAVRTVSIPVRVHGGRAESLGELFDCVALRAVDHMGAALRTATALLGPAGWLAALTTRSAEADIRSAAESSFRWQEPRLLARQTDRILLLGQKN